MVFASNVIFVLLFSSSKRSNLGMPRWKLKMHGIKHFKKLTLYLAHPELDSTNNSCERALRPEKLAHGSSYFRDTLKGLARFEIYQTFYQTCNAIVAISLSFSHYLLNIFLQPKLDIERHPQNFTPQAVIKALAEIQKMSKKLDKLTI
jgi:hypothetical protein